MNNSLIEFYENNNHLLSEVSLDINEFKNYIQNKYNMNNIEAAYILIIMQHLKIMELENKLK